eukprot:3915154-Amphidinium_carterae.1
MLATPGQAFENHCCTRLPLAFTSQVSCHDHVTTAWGLTLKLDPTGCKSKRGVVLPTHAPWLQIRNVLTLLLEQNLRCPWWG